MGSIYRRGRVWWIAYSRGRRQFCESSRNRERGIKGTHADAVRLLQLREGDVAKGLPVSPEVGKMAFSDALDDVVRDQRANHRRAVDHTVRRIDLHLKPYFTGRRIADITTADLRAYTRERQEAGAQSATINRELAIVRRAFRLAHRAGYVLAMPHVELLDESRNVRRGFLEPADFAKVQAALSPLYADVAHVAYITGWRLPSEVLTLTWSQVDLRGKLLRVEPGTTKGGEGRQFPITAALDDILIRREREAVDGCDLVFHDKGRALSRRVFHTAWTAACRLAGVAGRIPHDMRRSAVRTLERAGIPRAVAMQMVGHKTESIYRRYAIVSTSDIHAAGARLDTLAPSGASTTAVRQSTRRRRTAKPQKPRKR